MGELKLRFKNLVHFLFLTALLVQAVSVLPLVRASVGLTITPDSLSVSWGSWATFTISLATPDFPGDPYNLTLTGLPPGSLFEFSTNPIVVPKSGAATVTLRVGTRDLCPGTYDLAVAALHLGTGIDSKTSSFKLTITPSASPLKIDVTTDKQNYAIGEDVVIYIAVNKPARVLLTISPPCLPGAANARYCRFFYDLGWVPEGSFSRVLNGSFVQSIYKGTVPYARWFVSVNAGLCDEFSAQIAHFFVLAQFAAMALSGIPLGFSANLAVDGHNQTFTGPQSKFVLFQPNSTHTFTAQRTVEGKPGTRYVFLHWVLDGKNRTENPISLSFETAHGLVAAYETQHELIVESSENLGNPTGSGFYAEGSVANFSITSPVGFLIQQVFVNWTGDYSGRLPQGSVIMDGPKRVAATWTTSYFQLEVLIVAVVAIGAASFLIFKRSRKKKKRASVDPRNPAGTSSQH